MNNINKLTIGLAIAFGLGSCTEPDSGVNLQGTITNTTSNQAILLHENDTISVLAINKGGQFGETFEALESDYYTLAIDDQSFELFLSHGDDLIMEFDASELAETLSFRGKGAERNNYLAEKARIGQVNLLQYESAMFLNKYRERVNLLKSKMSNFKEETEFISAEELRLDLRYFYYLFRLSNYVVAADRAVNDDFDKLRKTSFTNPENFDVPNYISALVGSLLHDEDLNSSTLESTLNLFESNEDKGQFVNSFSWAWWNKALLGGIDSKTEANKAIESFVKENSHLSASDPWEMVGGTLEALRIMERSHGQVVDFEYKDVRGKSISLKDFKGKYVYIDFWATWCGPCLKEMPGFDHLLEKYHDKNIEFIGLSIDKADKKAKWLETVETRDIKGIQLNVDEDTKANDPFLSALNVNSYWLGIPQYALIDPEGKVISAMVPRPTDPRLGELLEALLD